MSARKDAVASYFEGFRTGDHERILALLTDDVVWDLPGFRHLSGKEAFDGEIENPAFEGQPKLDVDRVVEEGDTVVAIGSGEARFAGGAANNFVYCDVFTFRGDLIAQVESYLVPLNQGDAEGDAAAGG
jgi:uncharacterized protein